MMVNFIFGFKVVLIVYILNLICIEDVLKVFFYFRCFLIFVLVKVFIMCVYWILFGLF